MSKERGVFRLIWNNFISSLKPRFARRKLVGEDHYGTKYYEEDIKHSIRRRSPRYFEPVNKDDFEQELPAEWEAWLRYRRKDPPTQEEIRVNYQLSITKKQNAKLLKEQYSKNDIDLDSSISQSTPGNFPVYEEYKNAGRDYKPKDAYKG